MKKVIVLVLCFLLVLTVFACKKGNITAGGDIPVETENVEEDDDSEELEAGLILRGTITRIDDGIMYVCPEEGSWEMNSSDCFSVPFEKMYVSPEPHIGDSVIIEYNGDICETYPATLGKVFSISIVEKPEPSPEPTYYAFEVQYIRTDVEMIGQPRTVVISSQTELENYIKENKDIFKIGELKKAVREYGNDWFNGGHRLLIVAMTEPSSSIWHEVTALTDSSITIDKNIPFSCDEIEAGWHILIEPESSWKAEGEIQVVLEEKYSENLFDN